MRARDPHFFFRFLSFWDGIAYNIILSVCLSAWVYARVMCMCIRCEHVYIHVCANVIHSEDDNLMLELLRYLFSAYRLYNERITFVLRVENIFVRVNILFLCACDRASAHLGTEWVSVIRTIANQKKILEQMESPFKVAKSLHIRLKWMCVAV